METLVVLGIVAVAAAVMGQRAWRATRELTEPLPERQTDCTPTTAAAAGKSCSCAGCPVASQAAANRKEDLA